MSMDGNPHYEDYLLDLDNPEHADPAAFQIHAILAAAYEMRTANIIAIYGQAISALTAGGYSSGQDGKTMQAMCDEIEARMGGRKS